jgi:hypothetical protein
MHAIHNLLPWPFMISSNIILPSTPRSPNWPLPFRFFRARFSTHLSYLMHATFRAHLGLDLFLRYNIRGEEHKATQFSSAFCYIPCQVQIFPSAPWSPTSINQYVPSLGRKGKTYIHTKQQTSKFSRGKLLRWEDLKFLLWNSDIRKRWHRLFNLCPFTLSCFSLTYNPFSLIKCNKGNIPHYNSRGTNRRRTAGEVYFGIVPLRFLTSSHQKPSVQLSHLFILKPYQNLEFIYTALPQFFRNYCCKII